MYIVSVHCPMRHITHKTERDFCDGSMYICCPDIYYLSIRSLVFCVHLTKYVFNILHQQTPPFFLSNIYIVVDLDCGILRLNFCGINGWALRRPLYPYFPEIHT